MERVAMTRKSADEEAGICDHLAVLAGTRGIGECLEIHVCVPRPAARAKLERLDVAQGFHLRDQIAHGEAPEHRCEQSNLHVQAVDVPWSILVQDPPLRWLSRTASTTRADR